MRGKALVGGARLKRLSFAATAAVMLFSIFIAVPFVFFPEKAEAAITLRSSTTNSSTPCNAGLTINKPSGVVVGDVMVAQIASDGGAISTPSGWATIDNASYHSGNIRMATFFRIIEGAEGSNFTFPVGTSTSCIGGIMAFEGVDNGQVIDNAGAARNTDSNNGATVSVPSLTTASANTMLVASMVKSSGATSNNFTAIAGGTESYDFGLSGSLAVAGDYGNYVGPGTISGLTSTISSANWAVHFVALKPATVHMMLFWDGGGSAPAGWSFVTEAQGRYIRGEDPANYGATGGQATHSHGTPSSVTMSGPSTTSGGLLATANAANAGHTHSSPSVSVTTTASNEPAGYRLRLIRFNSGVPNIIPAGAIAIFDGDPGMPNDGHWTRLSAADNRVIKVDSAVGNGPGSDTHTHTLTWGAIGNAVSTNVQACAINLLGCWNPDTDSASPTHSHTMAGTSTSATATAIPPYFRPVLGKVDQNTPTLSLGLTAMFDGTPGGGWIVKSSSGDEYYRRFMRPGASFGVPANPSNLCDAGFGCDGHKIPDSTKVSGPSVGAVEGHSVNAAAARSGHTHTFTAIWPAFTSDSLYTGNNDYFLPPYFNVVIAEKVNFILSAYRWYEDTDAVDVNDPWSPLDTPVNSPIFTIPAAYRPPVIGTELRLRLQIEVNNNDLAAGEMQFKLQFKEGTDGNCTTGVWTDLDSSSGGGIWRYASSSVSNPALSIARLPGTDVLQLYVNSPSSGTNPNMVPAGNSMEYDFHIQNNGGFGATQYSFRIVEDSGILLSQYGPDSLTPICPTLSTKPDTENLLRHGNFFESGSEKGFLWVD